MKQNYILSILLIILVNSSFAQVNINSKTIEVTNSVLQELNNNFQNYTLFEINLKNFQVLLKNQGKNSVNLEIDGKKHEMFLYAKDIRGNNFEETWFGKKRQPSQNITFRGELQNGDFVRLTLTDNFIYGIIKIDTGYLVIDQLKSVTKDEKMNPNHLIAYKTSAIIEDEWLCGMSDNQNVILSEINTQSITTECLILEVATDADFEYFQDYGNDSNNRILGEFNNIQGIYGDTFDMEISVVYQNVWGNSNDPYSSTDGATIINEINDTWNTDFANIDRDLVHLFTGKNLGTNLGRASGIGTVCNQPNSSSYTRDRASAFRTLGHEIGHNLGGIHGDGINCGSPTASVMCQGEKQIPIYFSNNSISRIQNYISANSNCLTIFDNIEIVGENTICDNSTENYTLETPLNGQITWSISNSSIGSIISGQGTHTITIDALGSGNLTLTAVINIDGTVCGEESITKQIFVGKPIAQTRFPDPTICTQVFTQAEPYILPISPGAVTYQLSSNSPDLYVDSEVFPGQNINMIANQPGNYTITLTTSNACGTSQATIYVRAENCSGIGFQTYTIYPNPASEEVLIEDVEKRKNNASAQGAGYLEQFRLGKLYDFSGNLVKTFPLQVRDAITRMEVSNLKSGLYFLKIQVEADEEVYKIIVAH